MYCIDLFALIIVYVRLIQQVQRERGRISVYIPRFIVVRMSGSPTLSSLAVVQKSTVHMSQYNQLSSQGNFGTEVGLNEITMYTSVTEVGG